MDSVYNNLKTVLENEMIKEGKKMSSNNDNKYSILKCRQHIKSFVNSCLSNELIHIAILIKKGNIIRITKMHNLDIV